MGILVAWKNISRIRFIPSRFAYSMTSLHPTDIPSSTSTPNDSENSQQGTKKPAGLSKVINMEVLTYRSENLTYQDAQIVANQLEITPLNLIDIGSRNTMTGDPLTLILYPLNHADTPKSRYCTGTRQPFPTIFWMSCPDLRAKISRLEHFGLGNMIQDILDCNSIANYELPSNTTPILKEFYGYLKNYHDEQSHHPNETYHEQMRRAHHEYSLERWNMIHPEDIEYIQSCGWEKALNTRVGIAGMKKFTQVKCLHTHYAHHITRPNHRNLIGEWVHEILVREQSIPRDYFTSSSGSDVGVGVGV